MSSKDALVLMWQSDDEKSTRTRTHAHARTHARKHTRARARIHSRTHAHTNTHTIDSVALTKQRVCHFRLDVHYIMVSVRAYE